MWEMLRMLDKAQNKERDQDVVRSLREMRDKALADFLGGRKTGRLFMKILLVRLPTKWRCALHRRLFAPAA